MPSRYDVRMEYVALLRGINVGGHRVAMARLRDLFIALNLANVRTYIQTGNVFFETEADDRLALQHRIESHLASALGWPAPTCLRTIAELEAVLALDPFAGIALTPERRFAITFLPSPHNLTIDLPYLTPKGGYELIALTPMELFVVWHLTNGRPLNDYTALDKQFGDTGTTRFWHTTEKILAAAKSSPT
jgi:uncharacterized protein (DUF1697 family)